MRAVLIFVVYLLLVCGSEGQRGRNRGRRLRQGSSRSSSSGLPSDIHRVYQSMVSGGVVTEPTTTTAREENNIWMSLAPSTPAPDQVDCYVEVQTIHRQGGRCTMLGGVVGRHVCQSGASIEFSTHCARLAAQRARNQRTAP